MKAPRLCRHVSSCDHGQAPYQQHAIHRASCRLLWLDQRQHPLMCRHATMQVRAQGVGRNRHASEPALSQREALPSAPPLPDSGASAAHLPGNTTSQHVQYPSLHACHGDGERVDSRSSRRPTGPERERVSQSFDTGGSSEGTRDAQHGTSAREQNPERPAGALGWAMQATAGATGAALAALSARLPWHQHGHSSQDEAELDLQQTSQGASQDPSRLRRCGHLGSHYSPVWAAEHSQ